MTAAEILEFLMILSFGISWPMKVVRSYRSRTAKGTSVTFTILIAIGYICGIASKFMTHTFNPAFWMYWPNITFVTTDIILYFRNKKLDAEADKK